MRPETSGEKLFLFVRDSVLLRSRIDEDAWHQVSELTASIGGTERFGHYIKGAIAIHALRRLMRYWDDERSNIEAEAQRVTAITRFVRLDLFPGLERAMLAKLARLVIMAAEAPPTISIATRNRVLGGMRHHTCYLCRHSLDAHAPDESDNCLSLDHLWPASLGGDSIDQNLLPACRFCQQAKGDSPSWEWSNIHNLVLPSRPSAEALKVPRSMKIARHYYQAMLLADERYMSLREALLEIGPWKSPLTSLRSGNPVTFFALETTE